MNEADSFAALLMERLWLPETPLLLLMTAALALAVYRFRAPDRRALLHTLAAMIAAVAGLALAALLATTGFERAADPLHELFLLIFGMTLIRLWGLFLFRVLLRALRIAPPHILEDIVVTIAYVAWGMVRLRYAGLDLGSLVTTSAVITAVIAFSLQDTLGNILGGLALQLDDSISVGDWVKVEDVIGQVVDIRWRSTAIETRNWETVMVPNGALMKGKFTVLGRRHGQPLQWRRWVWFNVDLAIPPAQVIECVETALRDAIIPNIAREPPPNCVLMDFDAGYSRYAVRYWLTDLMHDDATDSSVRAHVHAALRRVDIDLAVPRHDLHMTETDERYAEIVRAQKVARRMAIVKQVDLFRHLTDDETRTIAARLDYVPFGSGEIVTRQGATAHWLYILTRGRAEVAIETQGQPRRTVGTLDAGSIFGEMGLMTGSPRSATVTALTDIECYRLDKRSFQDILESRPAMAEEIAAVLAERQAQIDTARRDAGTTPTQATARADILARIQNFFGLRN
jgi:small-conductance mechanosensitive channel/CRP-like cAMP-binding protein